MSEIQVLLAEDNAGDVFLVREALKLHLSARVSVVTDGDEAIRYFSHMGESSGPSCPDILLLDLNLPKADGHELLRLFRAHPHCSHVPVIIITSSVAPKDIARAEEFGASRYFRKPSELDEFMKLGAVVKELVGGHPVPPDLGSFR